MLGATERPHVRESTRACRAALFPVCESPSSFRIFFRSLLMSVLERSVMVAARCCRLDAMARAAGAAEVLVLAVVCGARVSRQNRPSET